MELTYILVGVLQTISISLGVGGSTLAITSFFVAINDGTIDDGERRIMGVIYIILRVAMVLILLTSIVLAVLGYSMVGENYFSTLTYATGITLAVLYINAVLMTKHIMPSHFGPGIQGGAWYTLGIIHALPVVIMAEASLVTFLVWYTAFTAAAVLLVYTFVKRAKSKNS